LDFLLEYFLVDLLLGVFAWAFEKNPLVTLVVTSCLLAVGAFVLALYLSPAIG
jgi:hypothetical protein